MILYLLLRIMADAGSLTNNLKMCQVSGHLLKKKTAIEKHLYQQELDLFSLPEAITLYDLTNTYFEGQCLSHSLTKRGQSKEKRTGCPLVTLALVLDDSGFLKRSHIFAGNVNEPSTLAEMIHELQTTTTSLQKPAVVMDAGIVKVYCLTLSSIKFIQYWVWKIIQEMWKKRNYSAAPHGVCAYLYARSGKKT